MGLYILKHIVLYTLVGGGLAGVVGWLAAGGNLAGVFGVVGSDTVYVNIAFAIGLSLLAWKFLAWASDHIARIFSAKSLQYRDNLQAEEFGPEFGREFILEFNKDIEADGLTPLKEDDFPPFEEKGVAWSFSLNKRGLVVNWKDHLYMRKAAWKDNLVMLLWAGYLASIPYLAHTLNWLNSDFATGVALVFFAVVVQTVILALKRDVGTYYANKDYIESLMRYHFLPFCVLSGTLFALGATGVITVTDPALAMVVLPSILLGLFFVRFLASSLLVARNLKDNHLLRMIISPAVIFIFPIVWIFNFLFAPFSLRKSYKAFNGEGCAIANICSNIVSSPQRGVSSVELGGVSEFRR